MADLDERIDAALFEGLAAQGWTVDAGGALGQSGVKLGCELDVAMLRTHLVRSLGLHEETAVVQRAADVWPARRHLADSAIGRVLADTPHARMEDRIVSDWRPTGHVENP